MLFRATDRVRIDHNLVDPNFLRFDRVVHPPTEPERRELGHDESVVPICSGVERDPSYVVGPDVKHVDAALELELETKPFLRGDDDSVVISPITRCAEVAPDAE